MRIEALERKGRRLLLRFEDGSALRVTEEEVLRFDPRAGRDLSEEELSSLRSSAGRSAARERAAAMIAARPLSRAELVKRLEERGASGEDAADAADWLEGLGALDDAAYAKTLVRYYSGKGYGTARLRHELTRRGVPRPLWEEALSEAPPPEETASRLLEAKTRGQIPDETTRARLRDMLLRRGFSWQEADAALRALERKQEEA